MASPAFSLPGQQLPSMDPGGYGNYQGANEINRNVGLTNMMAGQMKNYLAPQAAREMGLYGGQAGNIFGNLMGGPGANLFSNMMTGPGAQLYGGMMQGPAAQLYAGMPQGQAAGLYQGLGSGGNIGGFFNQLMNQGSPFYQQRQSEAMNQGVQQNQNASAQARQQLGAQGYGGTPSGANAAMIGGMQQQGAQNLAENYLQNLFQNEGLMLNAGQTLGGLQSTAAQGLQGLGNQAASGLAGLQGTAAQGLMGGQGTAAAGLGGLQQGQGQGLAGLAGLFNPNQYLGGTSIGSNVQAPPNFFQNLQSTLGGIGSLFGGAGQGFQGLQAAGLMG